MNEEKFLPEKVNMPALPKEWEPEKAVQKITKLTSIAKPAVEDIVIEFWIAHECLVKKKVKGWTWGRFCKETGYDEGTPHRWFEKYGMPITKLTGRPTSAKAEAPKGAKKHTKPDDKKRLEIAAEIIREGRASDDDIQKTVSGALATAIKEGTSAPRAGAEVATAVKQSLRGKEARHEVKQNANFERLSKHALSFQEGLQFWADGTIVPKSRDEMECARIIRHASTSIISNYARLGIDVIGIYETFFKGGANEKLIERIPNGIPWP
jgi:hypothetical protein